MEGWRPVAISMLGLASLSHCDPRTFGSLSPVSTDFANFLSPVRAIYLGSHTLFLQGD